MDTTNNLTIDDFIANHLAYGASIQSVAPFTYKGLGCWQVVTKGIWSKTRIFAKLPILFFDSSDNNSSQFRQCYTFNYHCYEEAAGFRYFFIYALMEEQNFMTGSKAHNREPKFTAQDVEKKIKQDVPDIRNFVQFNVVEEDGVYRYKLISLPQNKHFFTGGNCKALAQQLDIPASEYTLIDNYYTQNNAPDIACIILKCQKEDLAKSNLYMSSTRLGYHGCCFLIINIVLYKRADGKCFESGQLLTSIQIDNGAIAQQLKLEESVGSILRPSFKRTSQVFSCVDPKQYHKLFYSIEAKRRSPEWLMNQMQPGDLLSITSNMVGAEYRDHFAIYIGNGVVLLIDPKKTEKELKAEKFYDFIGHNYDKAELTIRRLIYCHFQADDVNQKLRQGTAGNNELILMRHILGVDKL